MYRLEDSPIYARTSGYLEHWYFDIGAHVKKGQLLATISSPEVDQQLLQAEPTWLQRSPTPDTPRTRRSATGPARRML